jgi:hypothetical protein
VNLQGVAPELLEGQAFFPSQEYEVLDLTAVTGRRAGLLENVRVGVEKHGLPEGSLIRLIFPRGPQLWHL